LLGDSDPAVTVVSMDVVDANVMDTKNTRHWISWSLPDNASHSGHSALWDSAPLNMPEMSNATMQQIMSVGKRHKVVLGIYIPTAKAPHNWHGAGTGPGCTNESDGATLNMSMYREDGLGAQIAGNLWHIAFALTDPVKYRFYYFPFQFFNHYITDINYDLTRYESFINLGAGERSALNASDQCICCHWNVLSRRENQWAKRNPAQIFNDTVRAHLRAKYFGNKQRLSVYGDEYFNIAVHVRRGDLVLGAEKRMLPLSYYIHLMQYLFGNVSEADARGRVLLFHIYSEWNFETEEFRTLLGNESFAAMVRSERFQIEYRLNMELAHTFHGLVTADALIMSQSSLSWSAAILSPSKYIIHCQGDYPPIPQWTTCHPKKKKCNRNNTKRVTTWT